jgi:hypothetical protein
LSELCASRQKWQSEFEQVERMREWVLKTEVILSKGAGQLAQTEEPTAVAGANAETEQKVGQEFDAWCEELKQMLVSGVLSEVEEKNLKHFLAITANLRPHLLKCYGVAGLPRTNNELEGFIRSLKTRYRRVSGRKNWGSYLLKYGTSLAYYEYLGKNSADEKELLERLCQVSAVEWRRVREEERGKRQNQLKRFRFRHDSQKYLGELNRRWEQTLVGT